MEVRDIPLAEIKPYEKNAKKHDERQIENVAESIRQYGFVQPIVIDRNGVIVIGHCRALAAQRIGMSTVPCVCAEDLTDEQIKALRIVDNKANESEWDLPLLAEELAFLDLDGFDFDFGLEKEEKEAKEKPEVPFTEILGEENNYVVLQFKNDVDWINAQSLLDIKQVQAFSTRTDGKVTSKMRRIGTARVLDGAETLHRLLGGDI